MRARRLQPRLILTDAPRRRAERVIGDGLRRYNIEQAGLEDSRPLAVVVADAVTDAPLGGILGRTSRGVLFIDLVFLPTELRGGGLGSRMLQLAEDEGRRRGCGEAVLMTSSFQAPGFYERHGWRRFGAIPSYPPGTSRIYFTKTLASPATAPPSPVQRRTPPARTRSRPAARRRRAWR